MRNLKIIKPQTSTEILIHKKIKLFSCKKYVIFLCLETNQKNYQKIIKNEHSTKFSRIKSN
jgi:hypothetical protein